MNTKRLSFAGILAIATLIMVGQTATAQIVSCWGFSSNSLFTNPANWNNGVPGSQDTAKIFVGVPITVSMNVNATVNALDIRSTMTLNGGNQLTVNSPTTIDNLVTVTGSETKLNHTNDMNMGAAAAGLLTIEDESSLEVENIFRLATQTGIGSELLIRDSGTLVDIDQLRVGQAGTGIMQIENGATVSTNRSRIAFGSASVGNASISGLDSLWETATTMNLGHFGGNGTVNVFSGTVTAGSEINVAFALNSAGTINMFGGELEAPQLFVGREGNGIFNLRGGTATMSEFVNIADSSGSDGTMSVILNGLLNTESLVVANDGVGVLNVSDGGEVSVGGGVLLGVNPATDGRIFVGPDGVLGCGFMLVGCDGLGRLTLEDGGVVNVEGLIFVAPGSLIFQEGGTLDVGLGLQIQGRVVFFSGDNDVVGDVELLEDGELQVGSGNGTIANIDGDIVNNGFDLRVTGNTILNASGQVSGTSPFIGTGLVRLNGGLSPGNGIGGIEFECDADFGVGAQSFFELGGTIAGSQHDRVGFNNVSLAGTLNVVPVNNFQPTPGQQFEIVEIDGNRLGIFNGLAQDDVVATIGNTNLEIDYFGGDGNDIVLNAVDAGIVLVGDVNLDGVVDLLDVGPFVALLISGTFQAEADINEDGEVNLLDVEPFVQLLSN